MRDRSARNHASSRIVEIVFLAFPLLSAQASWYFISGVDYENLCLERKSVSLFCVAAI